MAALTDSEIAHYREQGYVIPTAALSSARLDALNAAMTRVVEANPGVRPEKLVSVHIARPDGAPNDEGVVGDPAFLDACRDPVLLDAVESVIGPDIVLWGCQAFCKPGGDGMEVPMHQDGQYWPIRPLATCTAWIALDEVNRDNGCMRFVPGSHRDGHLYGHQTDTRKHITLTQRIADDRVDLEDSVDIELDPGQFSLHDIYLVHGSNANTSGRRRAGLAIRYMPASSHFDRELIAPGSASGYRVDFSSRPLWLLRGRDACGRNDFERGHAGS